MYLYTMIQTPEIIPEQPYLLIKELEERLKSREERISLLEFELSELKRMIFGRKSERFTPPDANQLALEIEGMDKKENPLVRTERISYTRRKPEKKGKAIRTSIPAHLPRVEEIVEPEQISEGSRKIGEEITEVMEYIPAKVFVRKIIRPKFAPVKEKEQGIIIAPLPTLPIPKSNVGPGLLAHILVSKFVDHLPYYRQAQIFRREGVEISKSTFNGWFNASCDLLVLLYECLRKKVEECDYLMADESPIPVQAHLPKTQFLPGRWQDENREGHMHTGYHWVYYSPMEKLVCFHYEPSRGRKGPDEFLKNFKGALQTDGYSAYNSLERSGKIMLLACMAHSRRKFEHALKNNQPKAEEAMLLIGKLYDTERYAREQKLSYDERKVIRLERSAPVLEELEKWLKTNIMNELPKSPISNAIGYTLNLWPRLKRYLEDGRYEMDNNLVENSIRPMVLGRKNYLFAGSHKAAQRAAMMYSFFGTCKINGINPWEWLRDTLTRIPDHPANQLEVLLPIKRK